MLRGALASFNVEQQAQVIMHYHARKTAQTPMDVTAWQPYATRVRVVAAVAISSSGMRNWVAIGSAPLLEMLAPLADEIVVSATRRWWSAERRCAVRAEREHA